MSVSCSACFYVEDDNICFVHYVLRNFNYFGWNRCCQFSRRELRANNYVNYLTRQNKLRIVPTFEIFMRTHVIHFPMGSNTDHIQVYLGQNGILKSDFVLADM